MGYDGKYLQSTGWPFGRASDEGNLIDVLEDDYHLQKYHLSNRSDWIENAKVHQRVRRQSNYHQRFVWPSFEKTGRDLRRSRLEMVRMLESDWARRYKTKVGG